MNNLKSVNWYKIGLFCSLIISIDIFDLFEDTFLKHFPSFLFLMLSIYLIIKRKAINKVGLGKIFFWILLFLYATPGLIFNKLVYESGFFTAIYNSIILITIVLFYRNPLPRSMYRIAFDTYIIGIFYVVSCILCLSGLVKTDSLITHEKAFLICPVLLFPFFYNKLFLGIIGLILIFLLIKLDPRTTYVLVISLIMIGLISMLLFKNIKFNKLFRYISIIIIIFILINGVNIIEYIKEVNVNYKLSQGAAENSYHRELLLEQGISEFEKAPFFGSFFTGVTSYDPGENFDMAPLHNDYLEYLTKGGIIGLAIFLLALLFTIKKSYVGTELRDENKTQTILLITIISYLLVMSFNPIMNKTRTNFYFYFYLGLYTVIKMKSNSFYQSANVRKKNIAI